MNTKKENTLLKKNNIYDLTKYTTTDYVGHLSCIVWFISCNLRCQYCYNDDIVFKKEGLMCPNDVIAFLKTRINLLDSVVLSGGEATMHNLKPFCQIIKNMGFKIKLDTNGTNIKKVQELVESELVDYIAIDFKAPSYKYKAITQKDSYDKWLETVRYLINKNFDFELRTTVNTSLLDEEDINNCLKILKQINYNNVYYIQNFLQTSSNIGNIKESRPIDKNKIISNGIKIEYRN